MIGMSVQLNGDGALAGVDRSQIIEATNMEVLILDGGMSSGRPSISIHIQLPDGRHVIAQTSARLFCSAGRIVTTRYPDLFEGD